MPKPFPDSQSVESAFYEAFRSLDIAAMQAVWIDSADATCVHPGGGLVRGRNAVVESWVEIFRGSRPPDIAHSLISAEVCDDLAVHWVREHIRSADGNEAIVIATNVYRRSGPHWRMLSHHASLPLVEAGPQKSSGRALH
jgi:ketosteroid isomerase-like protein